MTANLVVTTIITPEQAAVMLAETAYVGQRRIRPGHVAFLADEMRRGNFKPRTLIVVARVNDHQQLLDGQHRLSAVVASGIPQTFLVSYEDYTEDETKTAYIRIDQGLTRTAIDKYAVLELHTELDLSFTQVNKLAAACRFVLAGFQRGGHERVHDDEMLRLMRFYAEACRQFYNDIRGVSYNYKNCERAATLGLALVTYHDTPDAQKTAEFWIAAASGEGLAAGDARLLAFRHITQTGMIGGGATNNAKVVTPSYSIRFLAKCYNSWMTGEERRSVALRDGDERKPFLIYGTPFDGKSERTK